VSCHDTSGRGGLPILIANGFSLFSIPLHVVRWQYRRRGFENHVIPYRLADMCDVEAFAEHIAASVEQFCDARHLAKVNLMGISLGGIAGLAAIKRHGIAHRVATFVSVCAPFRGVQWALAGLPTVLYARIGLQLHEDSMYVQNLAALPLPDGPHYVAVSGRYDLICPSWTSSLKGAINIILPTGHSGTIGDPRIVAAVVPHLQ
jgi:pimeloyl-ACP methyl ester carboxylesterase